MQTRQCGVGGAGGPVQLGRQQQDVCVCVPGEAADPSRAVLCMQVVDTETGEFKVDKVRTSSGYFLKRGQTDIIKRIEHRLAEWTRLPVENGEPLHVLHYQVRPGVWTVVPSRAPLH